ncbi:hypothetical protein H7169_00885 [Candidatus Gracilibacteria bacterium]|nr:hypothetical protein [Candidatus Gracilibacteria bacterium]
MLATQELRQPYSHLDVDMVVIAELANGLPGLKDRVTDIIKETIGIDELPERVRSWIYQLCIPHTAGLEPKPFTGKLALPIDLASLSQR